MALSAVPGKKRVVRLEDRFEFQGALLTVSKVVAFAPRCSGSSSGARKLGMPEP